MHVLTICKFHFEAFFIPIKIICLVQPTMLHIKKLMGMHNKETYTCVCVRIDICVYAKYTRIIRVCIVQIYLSCTVYPHGNKKLFHHVNREKMDQLRSSSYSSSGEQQFIDKKENTVLVQIEFRYYWRMWSNISLFWSIPCWFVVMILGYANTTWPVLSGCETINFCYMTSAIIHYVHDYEFETSWL